MSPGKLPLLVPTASGYSQMGLWGMEGSDVGFTREDNG